MLISRNVARLYLASMALTALVPATLLAQAPQATIAQPPAAAAPALPPPSPINEAFAKAAGDVLQKADVPGGARVDLLIDPLIDGNTGAQSLATRTMEGQLRSLIADRYASKFQVKPFSTENLANNPFVFIGTFTPIHSTPKTDGPKDAYRICFAILDLKARKIISKGFARATELGIRSVPTPAFQESPVWVKDASIDGYVRTCQGTKAGDPINPVYLERINVASVIAEAIQAYDRRQFAKALDLYTKASQQPGGDQLRVHNGLYLSNLKLNRKAEAEKAFTRLIDYGMQGDRIGLMMLFRPGTTKFVGQSISNAYPMWLKAIAAKSSAQKTCLDVVGHASRTGSEPFNDKLSALRAEAVRANLEKLAPGQAGQFKSSGKGWHETIIGTGKDNVSDALDRRVEFKVNKCA